jgi:hypothetical protein
MGIVDRILSYASTPWKAATIVLSILIGGIGLVVYENREDVVEKLLSSSRPVLNAAEVPAALDKLAADSGADLVQLWAVDLGTNSQSFIAARRRDEGVPVVPTPRRLPIIVEVSDIGALTRILEGNPACVELAAMGSPLVKRLAERGMKHGCAIPIPPSAQHFIGIIYLAWLIPPDADAEKLAISAARATSADLIAR